MQNILAHPVLSAALPAVIVVFAHPDDDLLYFYQTLKILKPQKLTLICTTGQFSRDGARRLAELSAMAEYVGGELINLGLEDRIGQPLDQQALRDQLAQVAHQPGCPVFTHGPCGEYGHRHHVDVFLSVLNQFDADTWCIAGPLIADTHHDLSAVELINKKQLLKHIYSSQNVADFIPTAERFCQVRACAFADVLLSTSQNHKVSHRRAEAFIQLLEQAYFQSLSKLPVEARAAVDYFGLDRFRQRIRGRLIEWMDYFTANQSDTGTIDWFDKSSVAT